jgi:hypothetical protein
MTSRQARKQILLLEAEVHRAILQRDFVELKMLLHSESKAEPPAHPILDNAGLIWAGISAFWRFRQRRGSVFSHLLSEAGLFALRRFGVQGRPR